MHGPGLTWLLPEYVLFHQAATELDVLSQYSIVVPDTYLMQDLQELEQPKAATVTSAVLAGILSGTTGLREYEVCLSPLASPPAMC